MTTNNPKNIREVRAWADELNLKYKLEQDKLEKEACAMSCNNNEELKALFDVGKHQHNDDQITVKAILSHFWHAYAKTDGTMDWPNNRDGDILRGSFEILSKLDSEACALSEKLKVAVSIKIDDVLTAADAYANAPVNLTGPTYFEDKSNKDKLRWALDNAITSYAQALADEQKAELEVKLDAEVEMRERNAKSQQHQRSEAQREKARADKLERELNALINKHCDTDNILEAARLLCVNLDNGGVGHKALVENFRKLDDAI